MKSKTPKSKGTVKLVKKVKQNLYYEPELTVTLDAGAKAPELSGNGYDVFVKASADLNGHFKHTIQPGGLQVVDTGFTAAVPEGQILVFESALAQKGLYVKQVVSTEDARVKLYIHNLGKEILVINNNDKIARMYLVNAYTPKLTVKNAI